MFTSLKNPLTFENYFIFACAACFENGNHNVNLIGVDWTAGSQDPFYIYSALRDERVGAAVAKLIGLAAHKKCIDINKMHVIEFLFPFLERTN